jgi:hypothetical protein
MISHRRLTACGRQAGPRDADTASAAKPREIGDVIHSRQSTGQIDSVPVRAALPGTRQPQIAKKPFGIQFRRLYSPGEKRPRRHRWRWTSWNWFESSRKRDKWIERLRRYDKSHEFQAVMR